MWELDYEEGWVSKNWCFWIVVLEKTLDSSLDCKEIKPVNPKGNQPWIFIRSTDVGTEAPIFRPPDVKSQLIGKDPGAGKDWGQKEKGVTEDEMARCHHWLHGNEFAKEGWEEEDVCIPWFSLKLLKSVVSLDSLSCWRNEGKFQ